MRKIVQDRESITKHTSRTRIFECLRPWLHIRPLESFIPHKVHYGAMFLLEAEHVLQVPAVIQWGTAKFIDLVCL